MSSPKQSVIELEINNINRNIYKYLVNKHCLLNNPCNKVSLKGHKNIFKRTMIKTQHINIYGTQIKQYCKGNLQHKIHTLESLKKSQIKKKNALLSRA